MIFYPDSQTVETLRSACIFMWRLFQKAFWDNQCYFWPGFNVRVQPGQCFLQSPLFCETAIIWNLHQVVSIFFQFVFRGLNIKLKVKLTFWTAISSHQVVGMSLTKGWVMENIPRWIWSFSCNRLAENKKKWAGHGLNTCIKTTIKVCFLEKKNWFDISKTTKFQGSHRYTYCIFYGKK